MQWLVANHTSPVTEEPMESTMTLPNLNLRAAIWDWRVRAAEARAAWEEAHPGRGEEEEDEEEEF